MLRRRGPGPFASWLVGIVAISVLGGCGSGHASGTGPGTPSSSSPVSGSPGRASSFEPGPQDFRAIRQLLATRARAVLDGDRAAYLATVDPRQPALVARQRVLFDNLAQLDVSRLTYGVDSSALVPGPVPGDDPVLHPSVVEHLQLAHTLLRPVSNPVDITFVRRGGRWLVGDVSQPTTADQFDSPQERPWYGVPVAARRVGPLTVIVDRSAVGSLDGLVRAIREDIGYDAHLLGVPPSYRVLVDATTNGLSVDFSSISQEEAAAVTFGLTATDRLGDRVTGLAGTAIKVNPKLVSQVVSDAGILRHELTHYLLRAYSGSSPKWLTEGVATWVQYHPDDFAALQVPTGLYDRLQHADALPSIGLFDLDPSVNYLVSQAAVTWLVDRAGIARLIDLMKVYRREYQGVNADALTPRALRQVYGVSVAQVVAGAASELALLRH